MYDWTHVVSVVIFYCVLALILVASFVLSDDLILRRVVMFLTLGEMALGAIVQEYWSVLTLMGLFLAHFLNYIILVDKQSRNRPGQFTPHWARHAVRPSQVLDKLDRSVKYAAPVKPGRGRHRRARLVAAV